MAITYPIAFPLAPSAREIRIKKMSAVAVEASPFTFQPQSYVWSGQLWMADVSLPAMKRANAEPWVSALSSLNGKEGSFLLGETANRTPQGSANLQSINARVRGASQAGRVLETQGWVASASLPVLKAGDWLQLGGRNLLTRSAEFDHADWAKTNVTVTPNTHTSPTGVGAVADTLTAGAGDPNIAHSFTPAGRWKHAFSIWLRSPSVSGFIDINVSVGNAFNVLVLQTTVRVTAGYGRKVVYFTPIDNTVHNIYIGGFGTFPSGSPDLVAWGAMIDPLPFLREHQPSTSAAVNVPERLYKVMSDAYSDASGYASVDIWPALRSSPADNAPLTYNNPHGRFMLGQDVDWNIDSGKIYSTGFSAVEDLRP